MYLDTLFVLDFADMTVDGSFPLGAAVMAVLLTAGLNPLLSILIAFACGAAAASARPTSLTQRADAP